VPRAEKKTSREAMPRTIFHRHPITACLSSVRNAAVLLHSSLCLPRVCGNIEYVASHSIVYVTKKRELGANVRSRQQPDGTSVKYMGIFQDTCYHYLIY